MVLFVADEYDCKLWHSTLTICRAIYRLATAYRLNFGYPDFDGRQQDYLFVRTMYEELGLSDCHRQKEEYNEYDRRGRLGIYTDFHF